MTDNKLLVVTKNKLERELKDNAHKDPLSIQKLFKDQRKLINDLNDFLKNKASLDAFKTIEKEHIQLK